MLKDVLIKEAQDIEVSVELDGIFESVDLSADMKQNFSTVFEQAVKVKAAQLAEAHINLIAEKADEKVKEEVDERSKESEKKLVEAAEKFFEYTSKEWLAENKLAVDRGIKADLFESMFAGLKTLVVEHNVELPEGSVDVVAEYESELQEEKQENVKLFTALNETKARLESLERSNAVNEATRDLTESQKEKVSNLIEGLRFNDQFSTKLTAIVEMAKGAKEEKPLVESEINNNNDAAGLNYVVESVEQPSTPEATSVNKYLAAAKRFN